MAEIEHWFSAAHEQFKPSELLEQAIEAERAGFDAVACSDHYQPWWEPGESGMAWVWLGSVAQATKHVPVGTAVTAPVYRYRPALVAQAWATLEEMYPGRTFLGIGSGESLNESPLGMDWPNAAEQSVMVGRDEDLHLGRSVRQAGLLGVPPAFRQERAASDRGPAREEILPWPPERSTDTRLTRGSIPSAGHQADGSADAEPTAPHPDRRS